MNKKKNKIFGTLYVDKALKEKLQAYLYSEGKTFQSAIEDETNYIIDNDIPIEKPVEKFLNIREKLIEKYGSIKEASKHTYVSYRTLMTAIEKIEKNKNFKPRKSTISMLSDLLEK